MKKDGKYMSSKLWMGSIVAALITSIGIFGLLLHMEKQALAEYEKETVCVAVKTIPKGLKLSQNNWAEYMEQVELVKSLVPPTAVKTWEDVVECVACEEIEMGVFLTRGMFETFSQITSGMEQPVIAGFKAEDLYQVAGGILRAGDRIHIYTVPEDGAAELVWDNVYVEQAFDGAGNLISVDNRTSPAQRVNVYLDAADVEYFYTELAGGALRVVKVCD